MKTNSAKGTAAMSTTTRDGYAEITAKVVEALERGVVPWQRPWRHVTGAGIGSANLRSKRPYRGINVLLLAIAEAAAGYERPWWVTFKQAKELGGSVRRGEKGTAIYFYKPIVVEDEAGKTKTIPLLRSFTVFNVDQCDGLESKVPAPAESEPTRVERIETAERIVAAYLANGGPRYAETPSDRAFYNVGSDSVTVPAVDQFANGETFYSTVFHELAHSTGHKSRLDREELGAGSFGSKPYAREELVAELGASFLRGEAGINGETELDQSAAYIRSWLSALANDPKLVVWAAGRAQKAADMILGRKPEAVVES
jgi:antirestriction protein ArdC